jgi:hypothetical protein
VRGECHWKYDDIDGCWNADCGNAFVLEDGSPADNHMRFCSYCGRILVADPMQAEDDSEDEAELEDAALRSADPTKAESKDAGEGGVTK